MVAAYTKRGQGTRTVQERHLVGDKWHLQPRQGSLGESKPRSLLP